MKLRFSGRFVGYDLGKLRKDLLAGLLVGIVAIPLGMAFAIASGVRPEYGLYTTVVAGVLISLFGGSMFQIGGPTGAFIPIVLAIVLQYGYANLLIAGFMAGVLLVLMGLFKLGGVIQYMPRPVTVGFTAGIAVTIFAGQIANFLGLSHLQAQRTFWASMKELGQHLYTMNGYSVLTAALCLGALLLTPKVWPRVPASLLGIVVSTAAASLLYPGHVATISSTYGDIPRSLPGLHLPQLSLVHIGEVIRPAFVIAMLGGIESLLSAVVADGMSGTRHNSNRELIGQGIANMVAPLLGGIPATGAIARTATNIRSGAQSPLSGVVHGLVVLLVLVLLAPYASRIPLASMAPILMVVAWNMSERHAFIHLLKSKTADALVLLLTFALTVFADLTTAVEAGMALAGILFIKRMSELMRLSKVLPDPAHRDRKVAAHSASPERSCPQISIYTVAGPLFFGAANLFERTILTDMPARPQVLLLKMGDVPYMDTTGEAYLEGIVRHFGKLGGIVLLSEVQAQPRSLLRRTGLAARIGEQRIFAQTGEALVYALGCLAPERCAGCRQLAFRECGELSAGAAAAGQTRQG
ncbi:SulP family inorganic anion transporter [Paenibacillus athensensis]|uniref:SulP family inorganic anion transporter n=1 Tax=Paenibacillus athensensis TaxID=1967502 RepID=UPI001E2B260E|nr:sulfate permease [Paenibacillus athensensis]